MGARLFTVISAWTVAHSRALATIFAFALGTTMTIAEVQQAITANRLAKLEVETTIYFSKTEQRFRLLEMLYSVDCGVQPCRPNFNERIRSEALHELVRLERGIDERVVLREARLQGVWAYSIDLTGADLERATLSDARFTGADFRNANLQHAVLTGADLAGAHLEGAQLTQVEGAGLNLDGASGDHGTRLSGRLVEASLQAAKLSDTDLSRVVLDGANLSEAELRATQLQGARLRRADLSGADLRNADLTGADLREADLRDADLREAVLNGVDLTGALFNIEPGKKLLYGAIADRETLLPDGFEPDRAGLVIR